METSAAVYSINKQLPWCTWKSVSTGCKNIKNLPYILVASNLRIGFQESTKPQHASTGKHTPNQIFWRTLSLPVTMNGSPSVQSEDNYENVEDDDALPQPLSSSELKALLVDSERTKLIKKLSEANQHNRYLKRQLHVKEDTLINFKSELAVINQEIQALVKVAEEIAKSEIPRGSRKIKGRYIQFHLHSRLEAIHEKLKDQIEDVKAAQSKEVSLVWCGMAESVQVMGTFDGWNQGEHLSPEYMGSFTKFSTTLMLRPGRYEIKLLVDGEWKLSPDFPTVGEGSMENNLLIVE